jgi:glycosyltransferase involved in cell wall biosynthesis
MRAKINVHVINNNQQDVTHKQRILYVHYGDNWLRGSEIVLLDILKSAKAKHYSPVLWCNSEVLAEKASALGIDVIVDDLVCIGYWTLPKWNFLQFFKQLGKAKQIITNYNISLVHCNNGAPCQWMTPVCKFTGTPLLLHLHARYLYRDRLTLLFNGASSIIGVSQSVTQLFKTNEFTTQQISTIYNGIDPQRVLSDSPRDLRAELSAKETDFVILYVGSLIPRKAVHQLLYAIDSLRESHSIKLAIVGDGNDKKRLTDLVAERGLASHVTFLSASDNVADIYSSNADCFISVPTEEVFGLTLAEASIAKLPVITSNIPGINEIYNDKETALLLPANNKEALTSAIQLFIENPCFRKILAANAHNHIVEQFSLEQQFTAFDKAYQTLLTQETSNNGLTNIGHYGHLVVQAFFNKLFSRCKRLSIGFFWSKSHE